MAHSSNRDMLTSVVGSMKTDEVLKEALDYSSDRLHNYNNCSSNFLLQRYSDYGIYTNLFNEPEEFYNEIELLWTTFWPFSAICPTMWRLSIQVGEESEIFLGIRRKSP